MKQPNAGYGNQQALKRETGESKAVPEHKNRRLLYRGTLHIIGGNHTEQATRVRTKGLLSHMSMWLFLDSTRNQEGTPTACT